MDKPMRLPPMDEAMRIALEEALERCRRQTAEEDKERHERLTANAIAMGFSSLEEQEQHEWDEELRLEDEFWQQLPEKAAAAGKTVEEYHRDIFSNKDFIPPSPVPSFSQCNCEGKHHALGTGDDLTLSPLEHPNPWFCPALLLEYRSQDRPDFWDYEELNRTRIETLTVEANDKSRRLDSKTLEKAWDMIGPITLPLPIWARAKPEILAMPRVDGTAPLNNVKESTPSSASASLGNDSSLSTSVATPSSPSKESEHEVRSKPCKRDQPTIRRAPFTANEKRHATKIVKHPQPLARGTRSHKIALFYELDRNGHLISSQDS